jgi:tetratricopeptide (TPR) repeat protein
MAQTACPAPGQWQAASLPQLSALAESCDENAFFHAHLGAVLLAQGQADAAAVALEKALLLNPDLPGAQLDYAQALAQIGLKGSARAILREVLQRPDIEPILKAQLSLGQEVAQGAFQGAAQVATQGATKGRGLVPTPLFGAYEWQWLSLLQTVYGHETNLNSATYTDYLTLYLSNGPVKLDLSDNARPVPGPAFKSALAVQGELKGMGGQELLINAMLNKKSGAASVGGDNQSAEASLKYSLPILAGPASGALQLSLGGSQFWSGTQAAYADQGSQLKFIWSANGGPCKTAPSIGRIDQSFPQSGSLNGVYTYGRVDWVCSSGKNQETSLALGGGADKAQDASRPGGNRSRAEILMRHEQFVPLTWWPPGSGQLSAWLRHAHTQDKLAFSELLGDLKSNTRRTDLGLAYWAPISKQWRAGLNLEATSQKSNNTLFNLKNSTVYLGIRWANG